MGSKEGVGSGSPGHRERATEREPRRQVVLKLKTPYRDGTSHLMMSPLEFMQRLAALVPRPRLHLRAPARRVELFQNYFRRLDSQTRIGFGWSRWDGSACARAGARSWENRTLRSADSGENSEA